MEVDRVEREVVDLHVEFERWFDGTSPSLDRVDASLAPEFLFVGTSGSIVPRSDVLGFLRSARKQQPVAIRIENVQLAWQRGDLVCATYEEWQTRDSLSTARRSSCVLEVDDAAPGGLRWLSVHETWIDAPPISQTT